MQHWQACLTEELHSRLDATGQHAIHAALERVTVYPRPNSMAVHNSFTAEKAEELQQAHSIKSECSDPTDDKDARRSSDKHTFYSTPASFSLATTSSAEPTCSAWIVSRKSGRAEAGGSAPWHRPFEAAGPQR